MTLAYLDLQEARAFVAQLTKQEQLDVSLMEEVLTDLVKEKPAAALTAMALVFLQAQATPEAFGLPK